MSSFALFLIIISIVAGVLGWRKGLLHQVGRLAGIILGIMACRIFAPAVISSLTGESTSGYDTVLYTILAYVLIFVVVYLGVTLLGGLLHKLLDTVHIGFLDHAAGAVFNILEWMLILSLILNLWVAIVHDTSLSADPLFDRLLAFAPYLLGTETALDLGHAIGTAIHG